jgi:O-antigen ligase
MELTARPSADAAALSRQLRRNLNPPAVAAWTLGFALVLYLAMSNGGYETVVRSEAGTAVWWLVLIGALAGILPARIGAAGWVAIGLLAAFAAWIGLAIGWSESAERTAVELGRVAAYLGVLVLAIAIQGRTAARHTVNGLACAIGLVSLLAVLSRLHPQAFPTNDQLAFLGEASARKLSYPLNYWNGLAAFAAIGVPLLLAVAIGARTLAGQAAAAAALPMSALCIFLTISRGGVIAAAAGLAVFLVLVPLRLHALGTLAVAAAGSGILISATSQRDALQDGVPTATALGQGSELLWLVLIVCAGVALLQLAMGLAARHLPRPALLATGRRSTATRALAVLAFVGVIAVAAGAPGAIADRWEQFKAAPPAVAESGSNVIGRLASADGSGRYQMWQAALDAHASAPWKGIGPGTYDFWWSRHGSLADVVRDAHSLYLETLAETGYIGFALLVGLLLWLAGVAVSRSLREAPELRIWIAAAAAGLAAFLTSAAIEWVWEFAAIAVVMLLLAAVIVSGRGDAPDATADRTAPRGRRLAPRAVLALLSVAGLCAVVVPMTAALATNASRDAAAQGRLAAALEDATTAERLQPYAATPRLQQALVLEASGEFGAAATAARKATADEPTNWRPWLILARIDARLGRTTSALSALREVKRLNPHSRVLNP